MKSLDVAFARKQFLGFLGQNCSSCTICTHAQHNYVMSEEVPTSLLSVKSSHQTLALLLHGDERRSTAWIGLLQSIQISPNSHMPPTGYPWYIPNYSTPTKSCGHGLDYLARVKTCLCDALSSLKVCCKSYQLCDYLLSVCCVRGSVVLWHVVVSARHSNVFGNQQCRE